jgi:hypothetical protein
MNHLKEAQRPLQRETQRPIKETPQRGSTRRLKERLKENGRFRDFFERF